MRWKGGEGSELCGPLDVRGLKLVEVVSVAPVFNCSVVVAFTGHGGVIFTCDDFPVLEESPLLSGQGCVGRDCVVVGAFLFGSCVHFDVSSFPFIKFVTCIVLVSFHVSRFPVQWR